MNIKNYVSVLLLFLTFNTYSQDNLYSFLTIDPELTKNANAVVRLDETKIEVSSIKSLKQSYRRVVTILNKKGNNKVDAYIYYDSKTNIKHLEATIYNKFGEKLDRYKKSDFNDMSAVSGGTLYSDNRVKYLEYTPIDYPYTVEFSFVVIESNTAYIPSWRPLEGYFISTQKSTYEVLYDSTIGINKKEQSISNFNIVDKSIEGVLNYNADNVKAIKPEAYSIAFRNFAPRLSVSLKKFYYEGFIGSANDWESLGKWMYKDLLVGRTNLSDDTKENIKKLVDGIDSPIEKAKVVYQFVQDNTRYISVQEGIGGMQPISASDVDAVKYGDCKGLTNYTKALLDVVGVKSNYTRLYGSNYDIVDVDKDFVSFQGQTNHVILNIPFEGEDDIWLECTSQKAPFGHIANFTDDRDVLVITPEGGKIVHTKVYHTSDNLKVSKASINVDKEGNVLAQIKIQSSGTQYSYHEGLQNEILKDQELHYKADYWDDINNLEIVSMSFNNDKDSIIFTENVEVSVNKFALVTSGRMLFEPNMFNKISAAPPRYRNRKLPFEIDRGFTDIDEYEIILPKGIEVEALQDDVLIENQFGKYSSSIQKTKDNTLLFKRTFILNKGAFNKEDYKAFRSFWLKVVKHDKSKIVLKQTV